MCFYSDGYCTVYEPKTIKKSRKEHKCSDCFKVIPCGDSYESIFTVYEGEADTWKICRKCKQLREGIVQVELAEGCSRHEAEPLLGAMFDQFEGAAEHYHEKLVALGRDADADWLAVNCNLDNRREAV